MSGIERDTLVDTRTVDTAVAALPPGALSAWVQAQRWFGGKSRTVSDMAVEDVLTLEQGPPAIALVVLGVRFADAPAHSERYVAVLGVSNAEPTGAGAPAVDPRGVVGVAGEFTVYDASELGLIPGALATLCGLGARWPGARGGRLAGRSTNAFGTAFESRDPAALPARRLAGEQSNTSYALGDRVLVKLLRRLEAGPHPEVEMTEFLTRVGFAHAPRLLGALAYEPPRGGEGGGSARGGGEPATIALLESFVPDARDAWSATLEAIRAALAGGEDPARATAPLAALGGVTAAMHLALASPDAAAGPAFAPAPFGDADRAALAATVARRLDALDAGGTAAPHAPEVRELVARVRAALPAIEAAARALPAGLIKTRIHGDYHLGQVLALRDGGYVVIDFEGEPARPLAERRAIASPLRDVAGMLRSFSYAAHTVAREDAARAVGAEGWERAARAAFLRGYLDAVAAATAGAGAGEGGDERGGAESGGALVPADAAACARALALFELDKALYEVRYELDHRPDWIPIPVAGAAQALASLGL